MTVTSFTAIVERERDEFASLCPELDVASQGRTVGEAVDHLKEAVELLLECADPSEVERRRRDGKFVTRFEVVRRARSDADERKG